jgi:hypothetical protein
LAHRSNPEVDHPLETFVGGSTRRWAEDCTVDLRLDGLDQQKRGQCRIGAADAESAQMTLHLVGEELLELPETLDTVGSARCLVVEEPVHIWLGGVQSRDSFDHPSQSLVQRRLIGPQARGFREKHLDAVL